MVASEVEKIVLDYAGVEGLDDILKNLSGVATAGSFLWTASDEGRTVECLEPSGDGYRLRKQHHLDCLFDGLPDERDDDDDKPAEADIESLAFCGGALWICGSHCNVRFQTKKDRKKEEDGRPYPLRHKFNTRAGRHLLGKVSLTDEGGTPAKRGFHLPFRKSKGSLHSILKDNPFLKPFIGLPSKENGLDIEGFTTSDGKSLFLGQRGPRVDRYAVVVELKVPATSSQPSRRWPPTSSNSMDWRCAISPISTTKKFWCSPVRLATPQVRSSSIAGVRATALALKSRRNSTGQSIPSKKSRKAFAGSTATARAASSCSTTAPTPASASTAAPTRRIGFR